MTPSADRSGLDGDGLPGRLDPGEIDDLFSALADERRRAVVGYLAECDGVARFDDLVEVVAERTVDGDATHAERTEVATTLHHVHLPKLETAGLVAASDADGVVEATERVAALPDSLVESP